MAMPVFPLAGTPISIEAIELPVPETGARAIQRGREQIIEVKGREMKTPAVLVGRHSHIPERQLMLIHDFDKIRSIHLQRIVEMHPVLLRPAAPRASS